VDDQAPSIGSVQPERSQHPPDASYSLQEAAVLLGVSLNTLRRKIEAGQVTAERISRPQGHVWRVHLNSVQHRSTGPEQHAEQNATQHAEQHAGSTLPQHPAEIQRAEAMAAYSTALLAPLVSELATTRVTLVEQAETIGRLTAELEALKASRTHVASNLTAQAPDPPSEPSEPPSAPVPAPLPPGPNGSRPWWRRWAVLLTG